MAMVSERPTYYSSMKEFRHMITRPFDVKRPAALEVLILLILCAVDMYSTVYWVRTGVATEANPLLAWTFDIHPVVFVLIKAATFLPSLALASFLARKHPAKVTNLLRFVILAYVSIYLVGVLGAK
ncbi:MAG: hypothetical protein H7Y38_10005 [Armatimonadetes bacterium]|nr:hypothetical protein [Armatimonadota bacterium]